MEYHKFYFLIMVHNFLRYGILNTKLQVLGTHNLMVERNIQTVKNIFKKVVAEKKDIYLAMLELKNTHILNENQYLLLL